MPFSFNSVFGKESALYQVFVWQVLAEVIATLGAPGLEALRQLVTSHAPITPLTVADAVDAALRGHISPDLAAAEASLSGISRPRFDLLLAAAGEPLAPGELAVALRRGLIPEQGAGAESISYEQGIREGRTANKWTPVAKALATEWPTPTDALEALLQGQVDQPTGDSLYAKFGGDPQFFSLLYSTRGAGPTPIEASVMANRGIIPWDGTGPDATSYHQAFLESRFRNKWLPAYRGMAEYLPPPRTVTAMIANGGLTDDEGLHLLIKQGLSADLAAAYVHDAHHTKTSATKELSRADILGLYKSKLIDRPTAASMLAGLGWNAADQAFELDYADFQAQKTMFDQAVSRLHSLFVGHKTDEQTVVNALGAIGASSEFTSEQLQLWKLERDAQVTLLTATEICDAAKYNLITNDEAYAELQQLGYSKRDAFLRLGVALHGAPALNSSPGGTTGG